MRMHSPPHPGEILKKDVLPELGLTVGRFATHLGISRPHLSKVPNGRAGIRAEMDLKSSMSNWLDRDLAPTWPASLNSQASRQGKSPKLSRRRAKPAGLLPNRRSQLQTDPQHTNPIPAHLCVRQSSSVRAGHPRSKRSQQIPRRRQCHVAWLWQSAETPRLTQERYLRAEQEILFLVPAF